MMLSALTGERRRLLLLLLLPLLASIIPGVQLQSSDEDSEQKIGSQIYRPVLQPTEAAPPLGTYMLSGQDGKPCIKATLGAEFIITEQKKWFFSLDPSRVRRSGFCVKDRAFLSLTLPDNAASLQFTFKKENKVFYITKVSSHLTPMPVCKKCSNKTYFGLMDHEKLFSTNNGRSFSCKSANVLPLSSELKVKVVPLQIQAFTLNNGRYGKEVECWADYNKRIIPIVIGAAVVGVALIAVLTALFIRDRNRQGYDSL